MLMRFMSVVVPDKMLLTLMHDNSEKISEIRYERVDGPFEGYSILKYNKITFMTSMTDNELFALKFYDHTSDQYYRFRVIEKTLAKIIPNAAIAPTLPMFELKHIEMIRLRMFTFGCGQVYSNYYVEVQLPTTDDVSITDARELMHGAHGEKWSMEYTPYEWYCKQSHHYDAPTESQADMYGYTKLSTISKYYNEYGTYEVIVTK